MSGVEAGDGDAEEVVGGVVLVGEGGGHVPAMAEGFAVEGWGEMCGDEAFSLGSYCFIGLEKPGVDFAGELPVAGECDAGDDGFVMADLYGFAGEVRVSMEGAGPEGFAQNYAWKNSVGKLGGCFVVLGLFQRDADEFERDWGSRGRSRVRRAGAMRWGGAPA